MIKISTIKLLLNKIQTDFYLTDAQNQKFVNTAEGYLKEGIMVVSL